MHSGAEFERLDILVTGASSGIGQAIAFGLCQKGAHVIATGRRGDELLKLYKRTGGRLQTIAGDLTDRAFVKRLSKAASNVDVLVNAAGFLKHAPFLESDPSDWSTVFEVNVLIAMQLSQSVAQNMVRRGRGHIVFISSTFADGEPLPFTLAYTATKRALRAISAGLRVELGPKGIRITEIAPGFTDTAIRRHLDHPTVLASIHERASNALSPDNVADAVIFAIGAPAGSAPDLISLRPPIHATS